MARTLYNIWPADQEKRRFQRVKVNVLGRFMLPNGREFPCQVVNMSPGGCSMVAPVSGKPGEKIIAYIDHIGRIEGRIERTFENGFAMSVDATAHKRDKLADQLTWLANRHTLGLAEDRRHPRIVPRNQSSEVIFSTGERVPCRVLDVSMSGAAVETPMRPDVGARVTLGKTSGCVVRLFETGFAIEFNRLQNEEILEDVIHP